MPSWIESSNRRLRTGRRLAGFLPAEDGTRRLRREPALSKHQKGLEVDMTQAAELSNNWSVLDQKLKTFNRLMTTKAAIGQTPKELVWTLNKAKLYRYVPVVPPDARHRVPLLLVFALMNRPTILDLRPGHSFVEYMVGRGYDVFLLDWGVPGAEDKDR